MISIDVFSNIAWFFLIGTQQVDEIWSQSDVTDFVLGNVHGINITDRDIKSLKGSGWLTDQVHDAFIE